MKFACVKKDLLEALQTVGKAVASKPQMPVMSGIYLKADQDILDIEATDYEIGIATKISAAIIEPGEVVLTGRYLQEVIRKLPGEKVNFTLNKEENIVHIQSSRSNFTLLSMDPREFPVITHFDGQLDFSIKNNILASLIKKTVFSCATDDTRPIFTGCYLEITDDTLIMAATNTHRLAVKAETLAHDVGCIKLIIPGKALGEILHIIQTDMPETVKVSCQHNRLGIYFGSTYLTCRLIEGAYPDYQKVIPASFATKATVDVEELAAVVERVSLISKSNEYNVIRLEFGEDNIHISSNNPAIGKAEEDLAAEIEGPPVNIAFNASYIADGLKVIDGNHCIISLNTNLNPLSLRDPDDQTFIYVVTPVRTTH